MRRFTGILLFLLGVHAAALAAEGEAGPENPEPPAAEKQEKPFAGNTRFWSLGAGLGTSFSVPWLIGTVQGTLSPFPHVTVELGYDFGFVHGYRGEAMEYFSLYPYGHLNAYVPLRALGGWYGGAGGGVMLAFYTLGGERRPYAVPALDLTSGFYVGKKRHYLTISYTLRTDFEDVNSKVSLGYCYRFGAKEDGGEEDLDIMGLRR
jgi:hypothetical protein